LHTDTQFGRVLMRRAIALLLLTGLACSAKAVYADTEELQILLQRNNCTACHMIDKRKYGPKLNEVAQKYADESGAAEKLAKKSKRAERACGERTSCRLKRK